MADIVNLRSVRKAKKRQNKEAVAATNRAKFGRTKTTKKSDALVEKQKQQLLDGAKLSPTDDPT